MTADELREILIRNPDKRLTLVVGSDAGAVYSVKDQPQVDFYDQDRLRESHQPSIGKKTAHVMFVGNGINSQVFQQVRRLAQQHGIKVDMYGARVLGTATCFLRGVFPDWNPEVEEGEVQSATESTSSHNGGNSTAEEQSSAGSSTRPQGGRAARGRVKEFILQHADFHCSNVSAHIRELLKKAADAGIETTEAGLMSAFYTYRDQADPKPSVPSERFPAGSASASQIVRIIGGVEKDFTAVKVMAGELAAEVESLRKENEQLKQENLRLQAAEKKLQKMRGFFEAEE